ncbi:MAG: ACT domain-containing protein [Thermoplasmata archaeon]|nr:ACT domain-containing protein [Thermoplasmata archaeon]
MGLREISLTLPNRPGTLARVARTLAEGGINVAAISVDSTPARGRARLVVNDPDRGMTLLKHAGYDPEIRELMAVRLEDRAGSFLRVLEELAKAKVNVQSVAILVSREGNQPLVGISATNLTRARKILKKAGFVTPVADRPVSNADLLAGAPTIPGESVGLLL